MTVEFKVFVTVLFIIFAGSVWHVNPKNSKKASPDWRWQGRAFNKIRWFRNDGTLGLFARILICLFFILCILRIWTAA